MNVADLSRLEELDRGAQEEVVGGADTLRLLATVAHLQAGSAADDLESIADEQETTAERQVSPISMPSLRSVSRFASF